MKRLAALALLVALAAPAAAQGPNHREEWRQVVVTLAGYAKSRNPRFLVLARDGPELVVKGRREAAWEEEMDPEGRTFDQRLPLGTVFDAYVGAIDGIVLNGLYCGPFAFDKPLDQALAEQREIDRTASQRRRQGIVSLPLPGPTGPFSLDPQEELRKAEAVRTQRAHDERQRQQLYAFDAMRAAGKRLLSVEDCKTQAELDAARRAAERDKVVTFAGIGIGKLDVLPKARPRFENPMPVTDLGAARNWLAMPRGDRYPSRHEWVQALEGTNYDIIAIDVQARRTDLLTKADVARLKYKNVGPRRLVLAVLPLGRATDWRWYWQPGWEAGMPSMLAAAIDGEPGSYVADLADPQWKEVVGKYLAGIVDLGFDGVVLDDLSPGWFEDRFPLRE